MAIQFHCPSCEAMIRVPDEAAGKKGTCPRCNEKLMVPTIADATTAQSGSRPPPSIEPVRQKVELPALDINPSPSTPRLSPLVHSPLPDVTTPTVAPSAASPAGLPALVVEPARSITSQQRNKARSRKPSAANWIGPAVCVICFIGFLAWYAWTSQPRLEGALTAQTVHDLEVKPALIPGALSGLDKSDLGEVLRHLKAEPASWASTISKITLKGTDDGVEVSIRNGPSAHFVSVLPTQSPALVEYIKQHSDELEKPRLDSIQKHAPALFSAWKRQIDKHEQIVDQKTHRDLVALPALVSGLGYHLEAIVNDNIYPCVYEDDAGTLYFLLPNATKSFKIHGRKVAGGIHVPANFTVKLTGSTTAAPSSRKHTKRKTQEERESENEGMNPDLQKSDSDEPPTSDADALRSGLGNMLSDKKPGSSTSKSKSSMGKKPAMMEGEDELMDDEMPAKSLPKKKPALK